MKIRSVLRLAALVPLALALVVVAIYLVTADQLRAAKERADLAAQVTTGAFQLNMLTHAYVPWTGAQPKPPTPTSCPPT